MSDYPQYPTDPNNPSGGPAYGEAAPGRGPRPASVDLALKLIWGAIAVSLLSGIATFVLIDSIIDQQLEAAGASEAMTADTIRSAAIVGAVVGLIISVAIYSLLAIFIGKGANWARIVYTVFTVIGVIFSVFGLGAQPLLLLTLSLVGLLLSVAAVVFLFRADANAWFKAR